MLNLLVLTEHHLFIAVMRSKAFNLIRSYSFEEIIVILLVSLSVCWWIWPIYPDWEAFWVAFTYILSYNFLNGFKLGPLKSKLWSHQKWFLGIWVSTFTKRNSKNFMIEQK